MYSFSKMSPSLVFHGNPDVVTQVLKIIPVLHHVHDVGMFQRDQAFEAGIGLYPGRVITQEQG